MCRDRVDDLQESRFRVADLLRGASQCFLRSLSLDGDYCDVICAFGRNRVNILCLPDLPGTFPHGCHSRIIVPLPDSMHFKTCRKASSSDDCERITGNPEVIGLSTGLVPRNAHLVSVSFTDEKPTYHYKSRFDGRFGDLAVKPTCLRPLFANDAYTPMRMRDKSYADNSSLIMDSPVLQSPPAWASIVPPDCALIDLLSCAIRISASSILICSSISQCCLRSAMLHELLIAASLVSRQ